MVTARRNEEKTSHEGTRCLIVSGLSCENTHLHNNTCSDSSQVKWHSCHAGCARCVQKSTRARAQHPIGCEDFFFQVWCLSGCSLLQVLTSSLSYRGGRARHAAERLVQVSVTSADRCPTQVCDNSVYLWNDEALVCWCWFGMSDEILRSRTLQLDRDKCTLFTCWKALSLMSYLESFLWFKLCGVLPEACTRERRRGCAAGVWLGRGSTLLCALTTR